MSGKEEWAGEQKNWTSMKQNKEKRLQPNA